MGSEEGAKGDVSEASTELEYLRELHARGLLTDEEHTHAAALIAARRCDPDGLRLEARRRRRPQFIGLVGASIVLLLVGGMGLDRLVRSQDDAPVALKATSGRNVEEALAAGDTPSPPPTSEPSATRPATSPRAPQPPVGTSASDEASTESEASDEEPLDDEPPDADLPAEEAFDDEPPDEDPPAEQPRDPQSESGPLVGPRFEGTVEATGEDARRLEAFLEQHVHEVVYLDFLTPHRGEDHFSQDDFLALPRPAPDCSWCRKEYQFHATGSETLTSVSQEGEMVRVVGHFQVSEAWEGNNRIILGGVHPDDLT